MAIHCSTSNLPFISGLSMWTVMSSIGWTAVNSLELTNFSSSNIQIVRLLKWQDSPEWTESITCSHKISLIVPVLSATIVSVYLLHRHLIFHYTAWNLKFTVAWRHRKESVKILFTVLYDYLSSCVKKVFTRCFR